MREFEPFQRAIARQFEDFVRKSGVEASLEVVPLALNPLHQALLEERGLASGDYDLAFLSTDWLAEAQARALITDLLPFQEKEPDRPTFKKPTAPRSLASSASRPGTGASPTTTAPSASSTARTCLKGRAKAPQDLGGVPKHRPGAPRARARSLLGTVLALFPDGHNSFYDFCIHVWTRGGEPFGEAPAPPS